MMKMGRGIFGFFSMKNDILDYIHACITKETNQITTKTIHLRAVSLRTIRTSVNLGLTSEYKKLINEKVSIDSVLSISDLEYDHLDYSRPIQPPIPHYHRTASSGMSTLSHRDRESNQSNNKFPSFSESSYDAPIPHPKQLNINVPPLPMKNRTNENLTPSPSSSTASTITQDDNIDAMISVDKPMNKNFLETPKEENATSLSIEKPRDESTD